jgi:hypothetical protein
MQGKLFQSFLHEMCHEKEEIFKNLIKHKKLMNFRNN